MKIFLVTVGIVAILVFVLLLLFYITLLRRGERYIAEIVEVNEGNSFGKATYRHTLRVRFIYQGSEREVETLTAFSSFFFSKKKTMILRERYLVKQIHIIYNPQKPFQTLVVEWLWKDFLLCTVWIAVGLFIVLAGLLEWF